MRVSVDYALYDISWVNIQLYNAVQPSYKSSKKGDSDQEAKTIDMDSPQGQAKALRILPLKKNNAHNF